MAVLHGFYIVDDQFFKDFPDQFLKGNKEENRPHYYAFKEEGTEIFWIIPLSKQIEKCEKEVEKTEKRYGKCDKIHIMELAGKKSAFLIQDMFPVTEKYLLREYVVGSSPLRLLDTKDIKEIEQKAKTVYSLLMHKNIKFTPTSPDVKKILESLKASVV